MVKTNWDIEDTRKSLTKKKKEEQNKKTIGLQKLYPGACFRKVPKTFRARKAIRKTATRLFC